MTLSKFSKFTNDSVFWKFKTIILTLCMSVSVYVYSNSLKNNWLSYW